MAAASRIEFELANGAQVFCVFLTDGGSRISPAVRNAESLAVLTTIGVPAANVAFIGSEASIPDGKLVEHLAIAFDRLNERMRGIEVERVYCLAWEGGHHDHDASQLVAAAFANVRGVLARTYEMPLYRGMGRLFRLAAPFDVESWTRRKLTFRDGYRLSMLAWRYHSQRSTWIGLFPETFIKFAVFRRELTRQIKPARFHTRPHYGMLFYERRFKFPYERFVQFAAPFIASHL